jgi:RNA polymerase sigma-70 factor (ECF subfamily)
MTPERISLRDWATTLMDRVIVRLRAEAERGGKSCLFDQIRPVLPGRESASSHAQIAATLGVRESCVKVAVHRYRKRFGLLLRHEIQRTVDDTADIEDDISTLIEVLAD